MSGLITDTFKVKKGRSDVQKIDQRKIVHQTEEKQYVLDIKKVVKGSDHGYDEEDLTLLRSFDLESEYGPCIGITRLERWERAFKYGLNPSPDIKAVILKHPNDPIFTESLWRDYNL